jgi:hypothetical protein
MILSLFVTREEFAAQRRKAQDEGVEILVHDVPEAITAQEVTDDLLASMELVYSGTYYDENKDGHPVMPKSAVPKVNDLLSHATASSDVHATALAITNLLMNEATMQAAVDDEDDLFMEWVTMHDGAVRHAHADTDGQVRPIGEKFDVAGVAMSFPGDISAPIELWINCRCVLRPTYPTDFHVRENVEAGVEAVSEQKWDGSAGRFTPEQWKSSCILHVCDGMEKSCHKLPVKEPGGALSRAGVHAAAARINQVDAPPEKVSAAKRALRGAYRQLGEDPPDVVKSTGEVVTFVPAEKRNPDEELEIDQQPDPEIPDLTDEQLQALAGLVPWHGVLAPEGAMSGDGRQFAADSLSWRDLPLPLTYQKSSDDGHKGSVTIGSIENIERKDGLMRADGFLLSTPEADEVVGLMAHFGKYGVSVDADDAEFDFDEDTNGVTFTKARICSASVVSIPAFAEAYVALGPWSGDEALAASAVEAVNTEDGPGWLTHPVDTDRLRDYWVRGPGALKIGWGTPGDFNRCRLNLAKYVKPEHLAGYCANRHYDALGFWPGRPTSGDVEELQGERAPVLELVASATIKAPALWFANPNLTKPTHLTVTDEGRVFGHIAQWGICHIGIQKVCTTAPHSAHDYAFYASGSVLLDSGEQVRTGVISAGGGHAEGGMSASSAIQHYDSTSTAIADVAIGEDEHGIWCAGWMRPGTTEEDRYTLRASDVSGDWRTVGGDLELVAVLAVNVNGFPVHIAASGGEMISLVAAGKVDKEQDDDVAAFTEKMADAFIRAIEKAEQNKKQRAEMMAALRTKYQEADSGL